MKLPFKITFKRVLCAVGLILTFVLIIISLAGCSGGVLNEQQYKQIFAGVKATEIDGNTYSYDMEILVDETDFNSQIEDQAYNKIKIEQTEECRIRGVFFTIKSEKDTELQFTLLINDAPVTSASVSTAEDNMEYVDLFFEDVQDLPSSASLVIRIEEQNEEGDTAFVFDNLLIFLEE